MRARPSVTGRPRVTCWPGGPYFTGLSSRLRDLAQGRPGVQTGDHASSVGRCAGRRPAQGGGAKPFGRFATSGANGASDGTGGGGPGPPPKREKCSRFSQPVRDRRDSWSISRASAHALRRSGRDQQNVSEKMRIITSSGRCAARGTRPSESARRRGQLPYSRRSCCSATATNPAVRAIGWQSWPLVRAACRDVSVSAPCPGAARLARACRPSCLDAVLSGESRSVLDRRRTAHPSASVTIAEHEKRSIRSLRRERTTSAGLFHSPIV